jgi:hypothetical protein
VDPSTPKETVIHHGHREKENEESENYHEDGRDDSTHWWLLLQAGRRVRILIHSSRLNSNVAPGTIHGRLFAGRPTALSISKVGVLTRRMPALFSQKSRHRFRNRTATRLCPSS